MRPSTHRFTSALVRLLGTITSLIMALAISAAIVFASVDALGALGREHLYIHDLVEYALRIEWLLAFAAVGEYANRFDYLASVFPISLESVCDALWRAMLLYLPKAILCCVAYLAAKYWMSSGWWAVGFQIAALAVLNHIENHLRIYERATPAQGPAKPSAQDIQKYIDQAHRRGQR